MRDQVPYPPEDIKKEEKKKITMGETTKLIAAINTLLLLLSYYLFNIPVLRQAEEHQVQRAELYE